MGLFFFNSNFKKVGLVERYYELPATVSVRSPIILFRIGRFLLAPKELIEQRDFHPKPKPHSHRSEAFLPLDMRDRKPMVLNHLRIATVQNQWNKNVLFRRNFFADKDNTKDIKNDTEMGCCDKVRKSAASAQQQNQQNQQSQQNQQNQQHQ